MCKSLLFDTCMLTGFGNRLLYLSCTKMLRRQVFREFIPLLSRFEHHARLFARIATVISTLKLHSQKGLKLRALGCPSDIIQPFSKSFLISIRQSQGCIFSSPGQVGLLREVTLHPNKQITPSESWVGRNTRIFPQN